MIYLGIFIPTFIVRESVVIAEGAPLNEHLMVLIGAAIFSALFGLPPKLFADWAMGEGRPTSFVASWSGVIAAASVAAVYSLLVLIFGADKAIDYPAWMDFSCLAGVVLCVSLGMLYALRPKTYSSSGE